MQRRVENVVGLRHVDGGVANRLEDRTGAEDGVRHAARLGLDGNVDTQTRGRRERCDGVLRVGTADDDEALAASGAQGLQVPLEQA